MILKTFESHLNITRVKLNLSKYHSYYLYPKIQANKLRFSNKYQAAKDLQITELETQVSHAIFLKKPQISYRILDA